MRLARRRLGQSDIAPTSPRCAAARHAISLSAAERMTISAGLCARSTAVAPLAIVPGFVARRCILRAVSAGWRRTGADRHPIPRVDQRHRERQICDPGVVEKAPSLVIDIMRRVRLLQSGHRLGPAEGGALARTEKRRFAPRDEHMEALFLLAIAQRFARMHV